MTAVTAGQHTRTWTRSGAKSATAPARRYRMGRMPGAVLWISAWVTGADAGCPPGRHAVPK